MYLEFEEEFLAEIYRPLNMSVDYSGDSQTEKLFRNATLQRSLSMQNSLSFKGYRKTKSLPAKIAWLTLNLRITALTFAFTLNANTGKQQGTPGTIDILMKPG
jgi:hypothetical protein